LRIRYGGERHRAAGEASAQLPDEQLQRAGVSPWRAL